MSRKVEKEEKGKRRKEGRIEKRKSGEISAGN